MNETSTYYVVRMVSREGIVGYYTGKAGQGWTSPLVRDAFRYETMDGARRKASLFNAMTPVHGFHAIGFQVR